MVASRYFQQNFVSISYTPSSSGTGRSALKAREFDFAGSDSILDMTDPEFIQRGMKMIPAFAAAVGVVYNVDQVSPLSTLDRSPVQMRVLACYAYRYEYSNWGIIVSDALVLLQMRAVPWGTCCVIRVAELTCAMVVRTGRGFGTVPRCDAEDVHW
eukprot:2659780-Rhodomonas_salina.6